MLEFNPAAERVFGHSGGPLIGRGSTEMIVRLGGEVSVISASLASSPLQTCQLPPVDGSGAR
ncbi:hypothetical protein [Thiohalomonas denitrificans]|uniref:hypothetical protein n=1 Tax=Thiohalomonas denitrificans TaxID=415747 RepID=UPI0026F0207F|nr:hypothetical protein [Thiohalomonas denitrificans]